MLINCLSVYKRLFADGTDLRILVITKALFSAI